MPQRKYFKKGQVWITNLSGAVGSEQKGVRPVLILKKYNGDLFLGVPLTSKEKNNPWYTPIVLPNSGNTTQSYCILSQSRTMDRRRLLRFMGSIKSVVVNEIHTKIIEIMAPKKRRHQQS